LQSKAKRNQGVEHDVERYIQELSTLGLAVKLRDGTIKTRRDTTCGGQHKGSGPLVDGDCRCGKCTHSEARQRQRIGVDPAAMNPLGRGCEQRGLKWDKTRVDHPRLQA
jgi:hypothetical protein